MSVLCKFTKAVIRVLPASVNPSQLLHYMTTGVKKCPKSSSGLEPCSIYVNFSYRLVLTILSNSILYFGIVAETGIGGWPCEKLWFTALPSVVDTM